jgi:hypothetical protein
MCDLTAVPMCVTACVSPCVSPWQAMDMVLHMSWPPAPPMGARTSPAPWPASATSWCRQSVCLPLPLVSLVCGAINVVVLSLSLMALSPQACLLPQKAWLMMMTNMSTCVCHRPLCPAGLFGAACDQRTCLHACRARMLHTAWACVVVACS